MRRLQLVLGWFKEPRLKNHPSDINCQQERHEE